MNNTNYNTSPVGGKIKAGLGEDLRDKIKKENPPLFRKICDSQETVSKELNNRIAQVKVGGKVRYIDRSDPAVVFYSDRDMAQVLAGMKVLTWKQEEVDAFKWWCSQADRSRFNGVVFEPSAPKYRALVAAAEKREGYAPLNLYVKPSITARAGSWDKFRAHLQDNICNGNVEHFNYLIKWMAFQFQRPGDKIGVAVVLQSKELGTGKSVVGEWLAKCLGEEYCPAVDTPEQITGKHNAHLQRALLVRAEEALHARDPRHGSRLNHYITGGQILIEPKGVDAFLIQSKFNMLFSSNKALVVPAKDGERRYFILTVAPHHAQDRAYFAAIQKERDNGGAEAFILEMLQTKVGEFTTEAPPQSDALGRHIVEGMEGLDKWWLNVLREGRLPWRGEGRGFDPNGGADVLDWKAASEGGVLRWRVPCAVVAQSAADHAGTYTGPPSPETVGRYLATALDEVTRGRETSGERQRLYVLPDLDTARVAFIKRHVGLSLANVVGAVADEFVAEAEATTVSNVYPFAA
ncbi:hypothetical protein BH09PSE1_BH09PSE1_25090 [soil metagenome]